MTSEITICNEQSVQEYEHLLGRNGVRDDERGGLYLDKDVLPRGRELDIQIGDRGGRPGPGSVLGKVYASAVQSPWPCRFGRK